MSPDRGFLRIRKCEPLSARTATSSAFDILEKAGVGCTPGVDFGSGGEGYIRFTYANSLENIKEGMDRLVAVYVAENAGRMGS